MRFDSIVECGVVLAPCMMTLKILISRAHIVKEHMKSNNP